MSLVSIVTNKGFPIIVSDRALSKPGSCEPIEHPLRNKMVDFSVYETNNGIYSYVQKTSIIKDVLCMGLVGIVADLKEVHANVNDFFLHREVNPETLSELFEEFNFNDYNECSITFLLARPDLGQNRVDIHKFGNWTESEHLIYGRRFTAGSGTKTWHELMKYNVDIFNENQPFYPGLLLHSIILPAVIKSMIDEKRTPDNLLDGWGSGLDVIYYYGGQFNRIDNIAYAFWQVNLAHSEVISLHSVIHESHHNGILILRNAGKHEYKVYQINQFNSATVENKLLSPFYESKRVISIIVVLKGKEHLTDLVVLGNMESKDVDFRMVEHDGKFGLAFSSTYDEGLKNGLNEYLYK